MNKNHGKGFFGFLAGVTAGGVLALLTAKRKGADVRKDLLGEWNSGKSGVETLKSELKGVAAGAKDGFEEFTSSEAFQKLSKEAQKKWKETRKQADAMVQEAQEKAQEMMEDAKQAIMPDEDEKPRKSAAKKSIPGKK